MSKDLSRIDSYADKIKKKNEKKNEEKKIKKSTLQKVNTSKPQLIKQTIYLSNELSQNLTEFYAKRMLKGIKENKYEIICNAIEAYINGES